MWPNRPKAFLVGLDQWLAGIITGWPDATLSAWAYCWERDGQCKWLRPLIDGVALVFKDKNHCRESYRSEWQGTQLPECFKVPLAPE